MVYQVLSHGVMSLEKTHHALCTFLYMLFHEDDRMFASSCMFNQIKSLSPMWVNMFHVTDTNGSDVGMVVE